MYNVCSQDGEDVAVLITEVKVKIKKNKKGGAQYMYVLYISLMYRLEGFSRVS